MSGRNTSLFRIVFVVTLLCQCLLSVGTQFKVSVLSLIDTKTNQKLQNLFSYLFRFFWNFLQKCFWGNLFVVYLPRKISYHLITQFSFLVIPINIFCMYNHQYHNVTNCDPTFCSTGCLVLSYYENMFSQIVSLICLYKNI